MEGWNDGIVIPPPEMPELNQLFLVGRRVSSLVDGLARGGKNPFVNEMAFSSAGLALGKVSIQFFDIGHCPL